MTEASRFVEETADLLVELGCEELPPKALDSIREAFFGAVRDGLQKSGIAFDAEASRSFSSPRRLALLFNNVASAQPDQDQERRGPAVSAAFDAEGKPTGAALGFARSVGREVADLETVETDKGQWLFVRIHQAGKPLSELIYPILEQALRQLPVPRPMRWGDHDYSFVRPVHWLVAMHGSKVLDGSLLGLKASNSTRGHRVHAPGPHTIEHSRDYADTLHKAYVMADQEIRKSHIERSLRDTNPHVHIDPALLIEVNNLVEWPGPVACSFEPEFLEVPHAALIASMQDHQKFFPVMNEFKPEEVTNHFIAISNIESSHESSVREGFERVIRPRLADARFFLEQDKLQPLDAYLPLLDRVIYQKKIGSVGDKTRRMESISQKLAEDLAFDPELAGRAARLSKCDLMTQMVGEFPELQGTMGRTYALASGEPTEVAEAIGEHYAPRFAGDNIPASIYAKIVSISDRVDSLVGIFAAGQRPSGNKDPFALRRSALGLLRILNEADLPITLNHILALAANELSLQLETPPELLRDVREFIVDRLRNYYRDKEYGTELINAVLASDWATLPDLDRRLSALSHFMGQEDAVSLAAANKRIGNILRKAEGSSFGDIDSKLLLIDEERILFEEINRLDSELNPMLASGDYEAGLKQLASLRQPVDAFFNKVMVMDEDPAKRSNRLSLLARLKALFDRIADLSVLG
jgi:glycyl-tRNA synthetase beta chain